MYHVTLDGFRGYRARFDDIRLVQEVLEELPVVLGVQPTMPHYFLDLAGYAGPARLDEVFDLFSCRFFDRTAVIPRIRRALPGTIQGEALIVRGRRYRHLRMDGSGHAAQARTWIRAVPASAAPEEVGASSG